MSDGTKEWLVIWAGLSLLFLLIAVQTDKKAKVGLIWLAWTAVMFFTYTLTQ